MLQYAGAINIGGGVMVLTQNSFVNNTADGHGGAVAYTDQCFTVTDTSGAPLHPSLSQPTVVSPITGACYSLHLQQAH